MSKWRKVKRYAGVWTIKLVPQDIEDHELTEQHEVDIENIIKRRKKKT